MLAAKRDTPRIINIVNFIRLLEPRNARITQTVLHETVVKQLELMNRYDFPGTFLLQYDALTPLLPGAVQDGRRHPPRNRRLVGDHASPRRDRRNQMARKIPCEQRFFAPRRARKTGGRLHGKVQVRLREIPDGYTVWGGYWNQAYYPSKKNAYMPVRTREGQIPVPIFRMPATTRFPVPLPGKTALMRFFIKIFNINRIN